MPTLQEQGRGAAVGSLLGRDLKEELEDESSTRDSTRDFRPGVTRLGLEGQCQAR